MSNQTSNQNKFLKKNLTNILLLIASWLFFMCYIPTSGLVSTIVTVVVAASVVIMAIWTLNENWTDTDAKLRDEEFYGRHLSKAFSFGGWLILAIVLYLAYGASQKSVFIYNNSIQYTQNYEQKTFSKQGFYDSKWKTQAQKWTLMNINKETFVEVTKIMMGARQDGANVAWKWVHENQRVPYEEFTVFFKELSVYIETWRKEYNDLEVECQQLAKSHNLLIDTFPNNLYNKIIGRPHLKYEYGFLSDSTNKVFSTKKENL